MYIASQEEVLAKALKRVNAVRKIKGFRAVESIPGKASRDVNTPCPLAIALGFADTDVFMVWFDGVECQTREQADIFLAVWPDSVIDKLRPYTGRFPKPGFYVTLPKELRETNWILWHGGFQVEQRGEEVEAIPEEVIPPNTPNLPSPPKPTVPSPTKSKAKKAAAVKVPEPETAQIGLFG